MDEYYLKGQMVAICEALLNEEIGVINASRRLVALGWQLWPDPYSAFESFVDFVVIDSETDHLPVDKERHNWSEEALERKDQEIASAEDAYRETAFTAALNLLSMIRPSTDCRLRGVNFGDRL